MTYRQNLNRIYMMTDVKFSDQFGFKMSEVSLTNIKNYLYAPKDSSSLAVTRILFGLAMFFDIPDERGGASMNKRWGDPKMCHFPLLPFIQAVPMPYMAFVYAAMWFGALGIMLGYKYRVSAPLFTTCHWYLLLIEKSYWNNHSYLFGLVALLLSCTEANCYWSIDAHINPSAKKSTIPYWNYFILKYQFFILYFMAGMKKGTAEWLTGYSVQNLSEHWVFTPFTLFLTVAQTDYLVVHWFIFVFDLTVAVWMMVARTRLVATVFCALFHLMNSRLFTIGMFPWVCLATMPLFYPFDWPKHVIRKYRSLLGSIKSVICKKIDDNMSCCINEARESNDTTFNDQVFDRILERHYKEVLNNETNEHGITKSDLKEEKNENVEQSCVEENQCNEVNIKNHSENHTRTVYFISFYVFIQLFLPYSHFITKGYNNWTNGLYGYSWDMMVHTWNVQSVVVKIVDNNNNKELYVDPYAYTPNDRWTKHGDMVHQYAKCLEEKLLKAFENKNENPIQPISKNISVYVDVWSSMNSRFTQRMFDPNVDILKANWSTFQSTTYLMPLLDEGLAWRQRLDDIRKDVYTWNNNSDVIFYADFPGYYNEKYIPEELFNVTLTVLEGSIAFEPEVTNLLNGQSYKMDQADKIAVNTGYFHKVLNIGHSPAFYMYTFMNSSDTNPTQKPKPKLPIFGELYRRFKGMVVFWNLVLHNIFRLIYTLFNNCC